MEYLANWCGLSIYIDVAIIIWPQIMLTTWLTIFMDEEACFVSCLREMEIFCTHDWLHSAVYVIMPDADG